MSPHEFVSHASEGTNRPFAHRSRRRDELKSGAYGLLAPLYPMVPVGRKTDEKGATRTAFFKSEGQVQFQRQRTRRTNVLQLGRTLAGTFLNRY